MSIDEMTHSDCIRILKHARLGRLACVRENQPYVVPIYFVCEYPYLYGFTTPGQKVEWMRSNPLVCVELDEVEADDQWLSILVFGQYEELPEAPGTPEWDQRQRRPHEPQQPTVREIWEDFPEQERRHAFELLQRHPGWWDPGCASHAHRMSNVENKIEQPLTPVFYRIRIDHISGRRATPNHGKTDR